MRIDLVRIDFVRIDLVGVDFVRIDLVAPNRHFEHSDAIKIRNGIIFDFYTGLPHIELNQ